MARKRQRRTAVFSTKLAKLSLASVEVIARRTMLMTSGACSSAEYRRMMREKVAAASESGVRIWMSGGQASLSSLLTPWQSKAKANVKRLRKRSR